MWRFEWEATKNDIIKDQLLTYNLEDCRALQLLLNELRNIDQASATRSDVEFADSPKQIATRSGQQIHNLFDRILRSAHADYDKKRIVVRQDSISKETDQKKPGGQKGHRGFYRIVPTKVGRIIQVRRAIKCQQHKGQSLIPSEKKSEHTIIDLKFTRSGCRKTVTKYVGIVSYCPQCNRHYLPPKIERFDNRLFDLGFRAWAVHARITLRLPYHLISEVMENIFGEKVSGASIINFMADLAEYYASTEKNLLRNILASPFIPISLR